MAEPKEGGSFAQFGTLLYQSGELEEKKPENNNNNQNIINSFSLSRSLSSLTLATPLVHINEYVKKKNWEKIENELNKESKFFLQNQNHYFSVLLFFVSNNYMEGLKKFLEKKFVSNPEEILLNETEDETHCTLIHIAILASQLEMLRALLTGNLFKISKTDTEKLLNKFDEDGMTALHHACFQGRIDEVQLLIDCGANLNLTDQKCGGSALHHAQNGGHVAIAKYLVKAGIRVDLADTKQMTPLHIAASLNQIDLVPELLEAGAILNAEDSEGLTALHYACYIGSTELAKILLNQKNCDVNHRDKSGSTCLHKAAFSNNSELIELLVKHKVKVDFTDGTSSPLHAAAYSGCENGCRILLKNGARVNAVDTENSTPLHKAAYAGNAGVLSILLQNKGNVNAQDDEGSTPLHKAAYAGKVEAMEVLLKNGAEVDAQDSEDGTPLHNAAFSGDVMCIKLLLSAQANLNVADDRGASPLHLAGLNGHFEAVLTLLEAGAQVDVTDDRNMTPLHHSIAHRSCIDVLLKHGAELDAIDCLGRTPLFYAVKNRCYDGIEFLVVQGANTTLKDQKDQTPFDIASEDIKELMQRTVLQTKTIQSPEKKGYLKEAAQKFNQKPKMGIDFLIENNHIPDSPEEIANFLYDEESLDKTLLGQYLGDGHEINKKILTCFVNRFDFSGKEFDTALRLFLEKFRLPSEAQQIDRCMEAFASVYTRNNPSAFVHEDTAYILAFSIILLNTDLHNPKIKNKMTKDQFFKNNKGISGGNDLPSEFLSNIYDAIQKSEIKMKGQGADDTFALFQPEKKGFLRKQGGRIKTWKVRYFVLQNNCLYYFKKETDTQPCGIIPLENLHVRGNPKTKEFEVYSKGGAIKSCKQEGNQLVQGHHSSYKMQVSSAEEMENWMSAIRNNIAFNPLFELIKKKKRAPTTDNIGQKVKFNEISDACLMCSLAYKSSSAIKEVYGKNCQSLVDEDRNLRYILRTNNSAKTQTIALCGNMTQETLHLNSNDIFTHLKYDLAANYIDQAFSKVLKKDFSTQIYGHSLGAGLAVIFALHLQKQGYKIDSVITFGQPKVIKQSDLDQFKILPLTRVVDYSDPCPFAFQNYSHFGPEIILLDGQYYSYLSNHTDRTDTPTNPPKTLQSNHIESALKNTQAKLKNPIYLPYRDIPKTLQH